MYQPGLKDQQIVLRFLAQYTQQHHSEWQVRTIRHQSEHRVLKCTGNTTLTFLFLSPPSSKCLHLLMASILLDLQLASTHSSLKTIFFVVLACSGMHQSETGISHS